MWTQVSILPPGLGRGVNPLHPQKRAYRYRKDTLDQPLERNAGDRDGQRWHHTAAIAFSAELSRAEPGKRQRDRPNPERAELAAQVEAEQGTDPVRGRNHHLQPARNPEAVQEAKAEQKHEPPRNVGPGDVLERRVEDRERDQRL